MIGMAMFGVCFAALLTGMTTTVSMTEASRHETRASQILTEKLDTIRLYSWAQITTPGYIAPTFIATQFATNGIPGARPGIIYTGRVTIADAPISEAYKTRLKLVTIEVSWVSGHRPVSSQMSSFISEYGMQSYIY
jgi:hypothetical protein